MNILLMTKRSDTVKAIQIIAAIVLHDVMTMFYLAYCTQHDMNRKRLNHTNCRMAKHTNNQFGRYW